MRKTTIAKLSLMAGAMMAISFAGAQTNGPQGYSVRLGLFMPSNNLASELGHTWFGLGVDYKLNSMQTTSPSKGDQAYFGISADYYSHGSNSDIPVAFTYNLRQGQMVWSAGLGPDFRNSGDLTSTGIGLGEQIGVAYEFGNTATPFFVAAKYFFSSKPELSGLGIFIGARF